MRITNSRGVANEDLTARARIRDAALRYFTEYGFARATIREIALAAGVSQGLVRHHFGSKEELGRACDAYVLQAMREYLELAMTEEGLSDPRTLKEARTPLLPFGRYLARALIDDFDGAGEIFDQMVAMTEQVLGEADKRRPSPPTADLRTRAALMVAMELGIPAFQAHISRSIGADIFSPEGDRRVVLAMLDITTHPVISADGAGALRRGMEEPDA
ncbi:TetR/AcrR family transcriptional regulator [Dactylosporangium roseum]|uniref:TetR/AcrR family transcriptional regulator n=1 Tax=Dactylosporangium roseum TaxID=47989 RepID=A0ABY5ZB95_9ACTN|nr:TetR/AcrR family transcriptional regulator [Dactylosporangium roseum]UWZ39296.1 TetR/AcrR family transcriptional regulator [Dactylosporangium roseum]